MHRIDSENHENFISMQIQKDKSSRIFCKKLSKAFKKFFWPENSFETVIGHINFSSTCLLIEKCSFMNSLYW